MTDWTQFGSSYDYPCFESQPRTYLIASTPRSGSHYLGHKLMRPAHMAARWNTFIRLRFRDGSRYSARKIWKVSCVGCFDAGLRPADGSV